MPVSFIRSISTGPPLSVVAVPLLALIVGVAAAAVALVAVGVVVGLGPLVLC